MFEHNTNFELSCRIRPISGFNPADLLEADLETNRIYLSANAKMLWFQQYCAEKQILGKIDTAFISSEVLKEVPDDSVVGKVASPVKEYWDATIFMNGEAVSHATVSGTYLVNDRMERDNASGQLRKKAIGAALSQAGFGSIDSFPMTTKDIQAAQAIAAANGNTPVGPQQGFQPAPQTSAPTYNVMQNSFFQAPAAPVAPAPMQNTAPEPFFNIQAAQANAVANDNTPASPLDAAKQMVWAGRGPLNGMTLGQILSGRGGKRQLEYIANQQRTAENAALLDAAKLILDNLITGK
jgi:hypothetical protein